LEEPDLERAKASEWWREWRLLLADCVCIEKENERVADLLVKAEFFCHSALKRPNKIRQIEATV